MNPIISIEKNYSNINDEIENYFTNYKFLYKNKQLEQIINQGSIALKKVKELKRPSDEAKICLQLTATAYLMQNYPQALDYATRCHELAEKFDDPSLFIHLLYLESCIYNNLAHDEKKQEAQQANYLRAVQISEEAASLSSIKNQKNIYLKGKVYLSLGAAHGNNPKGNLKKAENNYSLALEFFNHVRATEDVISTKIDLGTVYLRQNRQKLCQQMIGEVRLAESNERLSMQTDYLEAKLKFARNDCETALQIAKTGLDKAKKLESKKDELRFDSLLQKFALKTRF